MTAFTAAVSCFESVAEHPEAGVVLLLVAEISVKANAKKIKAEENAIKFRFT
jgi:hypothetical protein